MAPWLIALSLCAVAACGRTPAPPALTPPVSGTIEIAGLSAPVRVVRDRWGVPHIYAESAADLFAAQGFVQAEDRLFQMDLWRRAAQGRLSQVLGPNFIERDAMTRRFQYRGDQAAEWASYGADTKAIAMAFVRGVNTWVTIARARRPEAFVLAGWSPEFWSAIDLVSRTDAFVDSGDALAEVARAHLSDVVADAIRRVGPPPFFVSLAAPVPDAGRSSREASQADDDATAGAAALLADSANGYVTAASSGTLAFAEARAAFVNPSTRYLIHLKAPGWNVIGATRPWLPGVAIGHNERIAWGMSPFTADTQDLYIEPLRAPGRTIVNDVIVVKGRKQPFAFVSEFTPHGPIVATDRPQDRAFALRWSGSEPGAAAELGALALDRAQTWTAFREALARWRMPARQIAYADVDGNVGLQAAALVPVRRDREWRGWTPLDGLPHAFNPRGGVVTAGEAVAASPAGGRPVRFVHVLGITEAARRLFDVGPVMAPGGDDRQVRGTFDTKDWDRSRVIVAPGQSDSPQSPHFRDLAILWSQGEEIPLAFTDAAVDANAATTLMLVPRR